MKRGQLVVIVFAIFSVGDMVGHHETMAAIDGIIALVGCLCVSCK